MRSDDEKGIPVDLRALADMRSRLRSAEREASRATRKTASLSEDLAKAKGSTKGLQEEAKSLRQELESSRRSQEEAVNRMRMKEADAASAAEEVERLRQEIRRIKESKAWRAISRYRRIANRLSRGE